MAYVNKTRVSWILQNRNIDLSSLIKSNLNVKADNSCKVFNTLKDLDDKVNSLSQGQLVKIRSTSEYYVVYNPSAGIPYKLICKVKSGASMGVLISSLYDLKVPFSGYITFPPSSGGVKSKTSSTKYTTRKEVNARNYGPNNFNCYFYTLLGGKGQSGVWYLPVYPNEVSDSNRSSFSNVSVLGRSVDYQNYNGSSRGLSLTLQLHEELCSNYNYIHQVVSQLESACYPGYGGGTVQPPEIVLVISSHFKIRGILNSVNANWKAPIIDGKLVNCDVSLDITETTGPYTMGSVAKKGGFRG